MTLELVSARRDHVPAAGRIVYEAFGEIARRHGFPPDFPSADAACGLLDMLVSRADVYGVIALEDGRPVGSNFLMHADAVAGVGPITVACARQGRGIGRTLMQDVLAYARRAGITQVRLVQEAFNTASLSLYASLGFDVREALALMTLPAPAPDAGGPGVRPVTESDLPVVTDLSERLYRANRRNEITAALRGGTPALLAARDGRPVGYFLPGMLGHGVAETAADAMVLLGAAGRLGLPPELACFLCPLSQGDLFRRALAAGCQVRKMATYMTTGPYETPVSVWMPSVLY